MWSLGNAEASAEGNPEESGATHVLVRPAEGTGEGELSPELAGVLERVPPDFTLLGPFSVSPDP